MSTELQKLLAWWDSLASSKPKGYTLSAVEEKTRRDLINNAIFEIETLGDEQKALDSIEIFKLAATSSPTLSEAKSNAGEVLDALDNLVALGYKANTEQMQRYRSRAQFILSSQTHKRGALTWSDALGCGGASFWDQCAPDQNNWLIWVLGAAVVVWYGRKKKWF